MRVARDSSCSTSDVGHDGLHEKSNYRRALEGELERTIGKMRDIKSVQVHLALEDQQVFRKNERPSKASVTLTMNGGEAPPQNTVRGIASLVAGSVGGLEPEHVTIVDERGQALTLESEGSLAGLTSRQLSVQREVEGYLEEKASNLLTSLVGNGNARVQCRHRSTSTRSSAPRRRVDPDKQAMSTEQRAEVTRARRSRAGVQHGRHVVREHPQRRELQRRDRQPPQAHGRRAHCGQGHGARNTDAKVAAPPLVVPRRRRRSLASRR